MIKTRSCYVILIVMLFVTILTTWLLTLDAVYETEAYEQEVEESVNFGMSISVDDASWQDITVFAVAYANAQAKLLALFLVIFAVIFSTADITSGYIKNIGGQVACRWKLMISRAFTMLVYTIGFTAIYVLCQAVCNRIFFGCLEWGDGREFLIYLGLATLLNFALEMICMAVAIVLRNNVFSMIFSIFLCMDLMSIIYNGIDRLLAKAGVADFHLVEYTVTGKLALLSMNPTGPECMGVVAVGLAFTAAAIFLSSVFFEKRDI